MGNDLGRRALLRCGAACALAACGKFVDEPVAIQVGAPSKGLLSVPTARMPELSRTGGSILLHSEARDFIGRTVSVLVANTSSQGLRRSEEHTSELQSHLNLVCRLLLEKK